MLQAMTFWTIYHPHNLSKRQYTGIYTCPSRNTLIASQVTTWTTSLSQLSNSLPSVNRAAGYGQIPRRLVAFMTDHASPENVREVRRMMGILGINDHLLMATPTLQGTFFTERNHTVCDRTFVGMIYGLTDQRLHLLAGTKELFQYEGHGPQYYPPTRLDQLYRSCPCPTDPTTAMALMITKRPITLPG